MSWRHLNAFKPPGGLSLFKAVNLLFVICCLMFRPLFVVVMDLVLVFLYITYCGSKFHDEPPFFGNNFLGTGANLFFLSKLDKDLKRVIENIFLCDFKKGVIEWKFQQFTDC